MKLLVVGAGEMGRWFARAVSDGRDGPTDVAFVDVDAEAATEAAAAVDGRQVSESTEESFDVVCVAVPIPAVADAVETYADRATGAVVDIAGVMDAPVVAMRDHAPDCERVSYHPLFAASNAPGSIAVVADAPGEITDSLGRVLAARGNELFQTTVAEHDHAMETVQARAHAAILAFGLAAEEVPEPFQTPVARRLFDALDEMTGGDARVYADIQDTFDGAEDVADYARLLADGDHDTVRRLYRLANGGEADGDRDGGVGT